MVHKDKPNEPIHKNCLRCHIKRINDRSNIFEFPTTPTE